MRGKRQRIRRMLRKGPNNPKYLASCYGKEQHATYEHAKAAASEKPHIVKPYRCQFGNHYHIGRRHDKVK